MCLVSIAFGLSTILIYYYTRFQPVACEVKCSSHTTDDDIQTIFMKIEVVVM